MSLFALGQSLGEAGMATLLGAARSDPAGRDLETLIEDGSARPAVAEVLTELHGPEPMELVR